MRFLPDGPSIPDELLVARDEGRVVFFCGAGVSRAKAALADFFELAEAVLRDLGVSAEDPANRLLQEAKDVAERTGSGHISADRVFGLLERNFPTRDIERAVANALRPKKKVDLSAHRILLDLATTPDGKVRLVTTNFDRLFEACRKNIELAKPPRLPDPSRHMEMNCIVHLHGCVSKDYNSSEGDGFVLSSSEFGRAYLSDGWATRFFREILDRYVVVFIGYAADDPPVQYLLEALNRTGGKLKNVYAFQFGEVSDVLGKWHHKGVEAIAYSQSNGHRALWDTLEAWAARARDPLAWKRSLIDKACHGPAALLPHERGQIAHLVSTLEGARLFAESDPPPPAEWLCVLDPYRRYASTQKRYTEDDQPLVVPFDVYSLDMDVPPKQSHDGVRDHREDRKVSELMQSAWDGLATNRLDGLNLQQGSLASLRGSLAADASNLPPRLEQLAHWIARVSDQPAAAWWAAHQQNLHPSVQRSIKAGLEQSRRADGVLVELRRVWWYLFEAWEKKPADFRFDWYELKPTIDEDGWTSAAVRRYANILRPYLKAESNFWGGATPPPDSEDLLIRHFVLLDVAYPDLIDDAKVPDEILPSLLRELRSNLELAVVLEREIGGYGLSTLESIEARPEDREDHSRTHGLSGHLLYFAGLFQRLESNSPDDAKHEFTCWSVGDQSVFDKLRIWASAKASVASPAAFAELIVGLSDDSFWSGNNQSELLTSLADRWNDLSKRARKRIEVRLLRGRNSFPGEDLDEFKGRRAWGILNRIHWLSSKGCSFTFDIDAETKKLRAHAPDWEEAFAARSAQSHGSRGGFVRTDTDHAALLSVPLPSVLTKASELSGRTDDFLVERDPFAGLCNDHPVLAFRVLVGEAKRNSYPEWAWRSFLRRDARSRDTARLSTSIAARLSSFPATAIAPIVRPVSDWLANRSEMLATASPPHFRALVASITKLLQGEPDSGRSGIVRSSGAPDWTMEAINSATGQVAQALMHDTMTKSVKAGNGFPRPWLDKAERLLQLPGDLRRHALVIFAHNLIWFYWVDPVWTESNLISVLDNDDTEDRNAVWHGFLWSARVPPPKLFKRMKGALLNAVTDGPIERRGYSESLSGILLAGWGLARPGATPCISDSEMRSALVRSSDEFRMHTLWTLKNWSKGPSARTWRERKLSFLKNVWPRQKSVKSPQISARLCDLAFSDLHQFQKVSEAVLPLLETAEQRFLSLPELRKSKDSIVDRHPEQTLAILHAVLPEQVSMWPYGMGEILDRLIERMGHPVRDERLLELRRRWDSR